MASTLRRNICALSTPDASPLDINQDYLEQHLPKYIQYSVQYWPDHLHRSQTSTEGWRDDDAKVLNFFQNFFLNWLEALSLIKSTADAIRLVTHLHSVTLVSKSL
jgi:hypothetical protein